MSRSDGVVSVPLRCSGCDASFVLHLLVHSDGPVPDREPMCPSCLVVDDDDDDDIDIIIDGYSSTSVSGTTTTDRSSIRSSSSFDYAISTVLITEGSPPCAVCMEEFELGCVARRLTCSHMYHSECILPWLSCRDSCPLCRSRIAAAAAAAEETEEVVDDRRVTLSLGPDGEAAAAAARLRPAGGRHVGL